ncbi:MAG: SpoIIE family protein phosphatase [Candidatus Riflebacteria bacterium]|nr:SpoIIE family protein phosphatase [Candidatus Riflebacteria bacterium]
MNSIRRVLLNELEKWLFALIFLLPTFLMLYFSLKCEFVERLQESNALFRKIVKNYFNTMDLSSNISTSLRRYFNSLSSYSPAEVNPEKFLFQKFQALKKKFPSIFEIAIFDSKEHFIPEYSDLPEYHPLLASLGVDLRQFFQGDPDLLSKNINNYLPLLGTFLPDDFLTVSNKQLTLRSFHKKRQFFEIFAMTKDQTTPGLIVWISGETDFEDLKYYLLVESDKIWKTPGFPQIVDLKDPKNEYFFSNLLPVLNAEEEEPIFFQDQVWAQKKISPTKRLFYSLPDNGIKAFNASMLELNRNICIVFLLLLVSIRFLSFYTEKFSLKTKLMFIFFYTTIIPIILFGISGRNLINEKQRNLEKKLEVHHEKILEDVDRKIMEYCSIIEKSAKKLRSPSLNNSQLQLFINKFEPNLVLIYDVNGKEIEKKIFAVEDFSGNPGPFLNFIPKFNHFVVSQLLKNDTNIAREDSPADLVERAAAESFGGDASEMLRLYETSMGRLFCVSIGGVQFHVLSFFIKDNHEKISGNMFFLWGKNNWSRKLATWKSSFKEKYPESRIEIATDHGENPLIPGSWDYYKELLPIHEKVFKNGQTFLVSSIKGYSIIDKDLFVESSLEPLQIAKDKIKNRLIGIAILMLGFGLSTTILFSYHLLHPLKNLATGIEAMKNRSFSKHLPVLYNDEVGQLTRSFNDMMEGMQDLEVGKVVQETFFPRESINRNSWEIFGYSDSANKLGGDYFDFFPLKDGSWLLLIGDVVGQGVQAALVVGLVKALINYPENRASPSELLGMLNTALFKIFKGKRCMTCFLGIFSSEENNLVVSNAGHIFPFLLEGDKINEITCHYPALGVSSDSVFKNEAIAMEKHSGVVFFTDGIVEAKSTKNEPVGTNCLKASLPGLMKNSAPETIRAIRGWHKKMTDGVPLTDDATIMVLQKNVSAVSSRQTSN